MWMEWAAEGQQRNVPTGLGWWPGTPHTGFWEAVTLPFLRPDGRAEAVQASLSRMSQRPDNAMERMVHECHYPRTYISLS